MPSTYTVNLGIEKPATGEQSGTWGDTTNVNFDIIDQAVNGSERVTLTSAGTSGSPNDLNIVNGSTTSSEGRNKWIEIYSASDLGGSAYVRLVPNDAEKILFIRNSLAGSQSVLLFQGTYNASNDLEIPAGVDMVVKFDGAGASATVTDVFTKLRATEITTPTLTAGTADINGGSVDGATIGAASASTGAFTTLTASTSLNIASSTTVDGVLDEDNMASDSATKLATQQSIKAYVDSQVGTVDTLAEILANGNTSGANNLIIDSGQALTANTINETTAGTGVTIDSVLLKDDVVNATDIETSNISANDGTAAATIANSTGLFTITSFASSSVNIDGGAIDGTNIGASSAGTGAFTTLTASGDLTVDTTTLKVDSTNNRVGMGTASPATLLHLNSASDTYFTIGTSNATADARIQFRNSGGTDAGGLWYATNGNNMLFRTNSAERMRINSSGSVGIGTTSPQTSTSGLHVVHDATEGTPSFPAGEVLIIQRNYNSSQGCDLGIISGSLSGSSINFGDKDNSQAGRIQYDNNNDAFRFFTNGATERVRIDGSGNVGIATTSPDGLVHVYNGMLQVGSKTGDTAIQQNTNAIRIAAIPNSTTEWGGLQWYREFSDVIGAEIIASRPSAAEADTDLIFKTSTDASNAVERMRITHAGNVGIGTTSPSALLDVQGIALVERTRLSTNDGTTYWDLRRDSSTGHFVISDDGLGDVVTIKQDTGAVGIDTASPSYKFVVSNNGEEGLEIDPVNDDQTIRSFYYDRNTSSYIINKSFADQHVWTAGGSSEAMRLNASGNLGIGTSTPVGKLELNNGTSAVELQFKETSTAYHRLGIKKLGSQLQLGEYNNDGDTITSILCIEANGDSVGVATTNPATKFEVAHATTGVANNISVYNSNTATSAECAIDWALDRVGSAAKIRAARITAGKEQSWTTTPSTVDGYLKFLTVQDESLNEWMRITSAGKIGIGTSAPEAQVQIRNQADAASKLAIDHLSGGNSYGGYIETLSGTTTGLVIGTKFNASYAETMRVTSGGDFLVGDTTNSAKLWVKRADGGNTFGARSTYASNVSTIGFFGADRNTTNNSYYYIDCYNYGSSSYRFRVADSGNATNTNNSYGAISDIKLKENIIDSGSQWDDIKAVRVRKYSLKSDGLDAPNQLGVIAQELESAGMAGLVSESTDRDQEGNDLGTVTKTVAYSVLYMKAIKALQEAMTRIETLETEVATLKGE